MAKVFHVVVKWQNFAKSSGHTESGSKWLGQKSLKLSVSETCSRGPEVVHLRPLVLLLLLRHFPRHLLADQTQSGSKASKRERNRGTYMNEITQVVFLNNLINYWILYSGSPKQLTQGLDEPSR